jgi:CPA1 family monovalent cation:H+ antiporter
VAALSSLVLKKMKFSYSIGLVIVGIIVGIFSNIYPEKLAIFENLQLSYDIVLYLILPILIFDAALNVDSKSLFKNLMPIILLLVLGVLVSAFVAGGLLSVALGVSLGAMLLFGAIISAIDPVAILALFKEMGAPKRLRTIIEGESMSNDSTVIILYTIIFSLTYQNGFLNIPEEVLKFFKILLGGTAIGAIVGILGAYICKLDKSGREFQIVLSIIMAYSSFIAADLLGFSGVMGSLAAGIVLSLKAEEVIKRKNREQVETFWSFFAFLANSFIFLLMGITQAHIFVVTREILAVIAVSIVILLFARYLSVMACCLPYNFFVKKRKPELVIPHSYSLIFTWGGLRGAFPAALVLTLPLDYPHRDLIVQLTFGYILFSLLVQGTSVKKFMKKLNIKPDDMDIDESICVKKEYSFPNKGLIDLIIPKVVKHCEEEGFFVREKISEEYEDYLMRMRNHIFLFRATNESIQIIAEPRDLGYTSTIMYETIVELNSSLGSIVDIMKPDKLNQIIAKDDSTNETNFDFMKHLSKDSIIVPLKSSTKNEIIYELVDILEKNGKISSFGEVHSAVLEREASMSTGLGDGIALPHARTDSVENITAAIGVSKEGIEFDAIDKKPVHIVIMILSPNKDSTPHLQFLAETSKIMSKASVREKIINAKTPEDLYLILEEKDHCRQ